MSERIPHGWRLQEFKALCRGLVNGGTPDTQSQVHWSGSTPWITGADFTPQGIGEFRRFVSETAIRTTATNVVRKGYLLIVTRTGVGKLAIAPCDIAISQDITGIDHDETKVDVRYFYYSMQSGLDQLRRFNQGTSINGIVRSDLERHEVLLPDRLAEQRGIAEVLCGLDSVIERTESLVAKHRRIKAGLLHDLFTRGLDANGQLRPTCEEAPELYRESPIGWIPRDWEVTGLRPKASPGRAFLKTGPFGSALKGEHWTETGWPVITIGSLGEGRFIESELLYVSDLTAKRLSEYQLIPGDVVFSRVADVGRSVVVDKANKGWIMSSNLMRISLDTQAARPYFLQELLSFDHRLRQQIRTKVNSGGREVANSAILDKLLFAWPDSTEQDRILEYSRAIDDYLTTGRAARDKLLLRKCGLMRDLLTGRVRVKVEKSEAKAASV